MTAKPIPVGWQATLRQGDAALKNAQRVLENSQFHQAAIEFGSGLGAAVMVGRMRADEAAIALMGEPVWIDDKGLIHPFAKRSPWGKTDAMPVQAGNLKYVEGGPCRVLIERPLAGGGWYYGSLGEPFEPSPAPKSSYRWEVRQSYRLPARVPDWKVTLYLLLIMGTLMAIGWAIANYITF